MRPFRVITAIAALYLRVMIRMIQSSAAGHAKAYFSDALSKSDYYVSDQELAGTWQGRLADRLGLSGPTTKDTFFALCENRHPRTGEKLTPRQKENRRVGYDINFHCPKSVSLLHVFARDNHVLDAFQESVTETMRVIEADAKTLVRKGGARNDRQTGELVWAHFVHQTARPVADLSPDPHLHSHCFVFNATWDDVEGRIKAGAFHDIKRDMPYYQALFHNALAGRLTDLGYRIRRTDKSFEVEGVPKRAIDLFSKRTDEIGRAAKAKGITDAKELAELGARTRGRKQKGMSMDALKKEWHDQVYALGKTDADKMPVRFAPEKSALQLTAAQCIDHALLHCFERASVAEDRRILATAYRHALGHSRATVKDIDAVFRGDKRLIRIQEKSRQVCTTRDVLEEEKRMVALAQQGKGKLAPLYREAPLTNLKGQQAAAVAHVLTTTHRVSIIRGAAGTGKTTLMREAVSKIEEAGKKVTVIAPTAQASRGVLREEGFAQAETVAKFLTNQKMQDGMKGQVLWVDEAGLLGTKDMLGLLDVATKQNARLILGGDTRQHASVVRGDALRILNTVAGIECAEVSKIYRQKDGQYRSAVKDLSKGKVKDGFAKLDALGFIKSIDAQTSNQQLVDDYVAAVKHGKSALVVSPTHAQGDAVTQSIREKLRQEHIIGKKEITATRLVNLNMTEAQKADARNFQTGHIVQFNQNAPGFPRGSAWTVAQAGEKEVWLKNNLDERKSLPLDKSKRYDVFKHEEIALSKGDKVMMTKNGFDLDGKRLNNGQAFEVTAVSTRGTIKLHSASGGSYTLGKDYGHLAHAHCITSHASQGKTVDEVFIHQPAATFPATDAKQFYVSVSRARDRAHIYTDDKKALMNYAANLGERQSAIELVGKKQKHREAVMQRQREERPNPQFEKMKKRDDYEPER